MEPRACPPGKSPKNRFPIYERAESYTEFISKSAHILGYSHPPRYFSTIHIIVYELFQKVTPPVIKIDGRGLGPSSAVLNELNEGKKGCQCIFLSNHIVVSENV